jgi:hypothetical protein
MSHQHPAEIGRDIKAERWSDRSTSQRSCQHSAEIRKSTKTESGGGATGQSPKAGQELDLRDREQHSKPNCFTLLREKLTK